MFIRFSVKNVFSFKDERSLSMVAANTGQEHKGNVFVSDWRKLRLIKSAAIYGANASGKSNLFKALKTMRAIVINSSKESQAGEDLNILPFKLNKRTAEEPSKFEIEFILDQKKLRYGFEATVKEITKEWLFSAEKIKETALFIRESGEIHVNEDAEMPDAKGLEARTRNNALFLSVCAQFEVKYAQKILNVIANVNILSTDSDEGYKGFTINEFENDEIRAKILKLLKLFDSNILDMALAPRNFDEFDEIQDKNLKEIITKMAGDGTLKALPHIYSTHNIYDDNGKLDGTIKMDFERFESNGANKLFALAGPILDTLIKGKTLFVDELDARLHPMLTKQIARLFNSSETNPKNAQLVFATHDTNLLDKNLFRRDQIWFTEKDRMEATDLYSLLEYKVRNDAAFEKGYLAGRYGAIPCLGDFKHIWDL